MYIYREKEQRERERELYNTGWTVGHFLWGRGWVGWKRHTVSEKQELRN
jgi:hypothetical protein